VTSYDPISEYNNLKKELKLYDISLLKKPSVLALNKVDLLTDEDVNKLKLNLDTPIVKVSALTGEGIDKFLNIIIKELEKVKLKKKEEIKIGTF